MLVAYAFARTVLPEFASVYSRHDFTLPQLFACLVLREHQKKSYRGIEALLHDCPEWCVAIGMKRAPDHATLHRAFDTIVRTQSLELLLDGMIQWAQKAKLLGETLSIDSTQLDVRYQSRHYEQRCRHYAHGRNRSADAKRSITARQTPKLMLGVDTRSHLILSMRSRMGMGSDAPDFVPLLRAAGRRHRRIRLVLADAGYDSHRNHHVARRELGVRSLIKAGIGRRSTKPPASNYRRQMKRQLTGSQAGKPYAQRAQSEAVNSMLKRNLTDSLRARTPERRCRELSLRAVVHNLSIIRSPNQRVETEPIRPVFFLPSLFVTSNMLSPMTDPFI